MEASVRQSVVSRRFFLTRPQKEIAAAQDAMLNGKAGASAMHLSKAMQAGSAK